MSFASSSENCFGAELCFLASTLDCAYLLCSCSKPLQNRVFASVHAESGVEQCRESLFRQKNSDIDG